MSRFSFRFSRVEAAPVPLLIPIQTRGIENSVAEKCIFLKVNSEAISAHWVSGVAKRRTPLSNPPVQAHYPAKINARVIL
ncbi:hypothetical protein GS625_08445 [Ruegeria sp. HKCCD7319]|nr:hypothetical protein [Ruegeria sp. HKCCD7319]